MKQVYRSDENRMREEFMHSQQWFFGSSEGATLISALKPIVGEVKAAYFVMWLPDQCEDTYWILVNGKVVVAVEIDVGWRYGEQELTGLILDIVECEDVEEYQNSIQGSENILQLKVALELSQNDIDKSQSTISKTELKTISQSSKLTQEIEMTLHETNAKRMNENSQFTISKEEVVLILQSDMVVQAAVGMIVPKADAKPARDFFAREVDVGKIIGYIQNKDGSTQPTSLIAVITDKSGDLITTYPGPYKRRRN